MELILKPIDIESARTLIQWRYEPPYDIYNIGPANQNGAELDEETKYLLNPSFVFQAIFEKQTGELAGFCSFGLDGQVTGGKYNIPALDIGMGIRPDLTGRGLGVGFTAVVVKFACHTYHPPMLRVTIAAFNCRAIRVWEKNGFIRDQSFTNEATGRTFVIFTRKISSEESQPTGIK